MSADHLDDVGGPWAKLPTTGPERAPASPAVLLGGLGHWVRTWFVPAYEAWKQIPPCWAEHAAMVNELEAAMELRAALDTAAAGDVLAGAKARAEWSEYRGRMMERLAATPGAACAKGEHREPITWDRSGSVERRREIRRGLAG